MAIALIVIGTIVLSVGMSIALKSVKPMYFNVLAGLIILVGTFFGLFGKQLQDKSSSEKSDRILTTGQHTNEKVESLKKQNDELLVSSEKLNQKLQVQALTIDELRKENTDLYFKLATSASNIYNSITGGESYGLVDFLFLKEKNGKNIICFEYSNKGKFPLSEIDIQMLNRNEIDKASLKQRNGVATVDDLKKYHTFHITAVGAKVGDIFYALPELEDNFIYDYVFSISTKYSKFDQQMKFIKVGEKIYKAIKLNTVGTNHKVIIDTADEKFPGSKDGKIKW